MNRISVLPLSLPSLSLLFTHASATLFTIPIILVQYYPRDRIESSIRRAKCMREMTSSR